ncbi:hypothetical protein [Nostoc sphaeroides]|uniref:Uncharacterized protein n=1 Tax=Nostoc sphaeroides CCNUC1 TaxID=2653204 RepID=A0A5P8WH90_9NOSO|nr:hypothetical protein [Nostoc sphaeroides]QFS51199.1 hypothetical protein GXM_08693 [Nostoc sphaeroides CCNUC1]
MPEATHEYDLYCQGISGDSGSYESGLAGVIALMQRFMRSL